MSAGDAGRVRLIDKDAALLAYVALEGPTPSRKVATLVWPERDEKAALNNLRQRLHKLRRATGARLLEMSELLVLASDLQVDPPPVLETGDVEAADAPVLLGPFGLEASPDLAEWLQRHRERRRQQTCMAWEAASVQAEAAGLLDRALACAQRQLRLDPLSEPAHGRVMRLHYLRGDSAAAIAAFEVCEQRLKAEFGLRPGRATLDLLALAESGARKPQLRPAALPAGLLRPPVTVGREQAALRLRHTLEAGFAVVVVGEAGMGKTRLLTDLMADCGTSAVYVQARPGDERSPYATLVRLLAELRTRLPLPQTAGNRAMQVLLPAPSAHDAGVGSIQPNALRDGVGDLLEMACSAGLAVLIVDDLHFADAASAELVAHLAAESGRRQPGWVLAQRPAAVAGAAVAISEVLGESIQARWIELQALSEADLRSLVQSLQLGQNLGEATLSQLWRHTGGNALFALEALREWLSAGVQTPDALPMPRGVEHLIRNRLARLSPAALALARTAALSVPDLSIELAAHVLETPALALADAWNELESAQVLRGVGFAHDLVHDVALQITPQPIAQHAHRRIAAFLDQRAADPARVARHWELAGDPAMACERYAQASRQADATGRLREAGQLLRNAAAQAGVAGLGDRRAELLAKACGRVIQTEGPDAAEPIVDALMQSCETPLQTTQAWTARATVDLWAGRNEPAEAAGRKALEGAVRDSDCCTAARIVASSLGQRGRDREALAMVAPWAAHFDRLEDSEERLSCLTDYSSLLLGVERLHEAEGVLDRVLDLARELGDAQAMATGLINQCRCRAESGDLAGALASAQAVDTTLAADGATAMLHAMNGIQLGFLLGCHGRYREALARIEAGATHFSAGQVPWVHAVVHFARARLYWQLGQAARAFQQIEDEVPGATNGAAISRLVLMAEIKGTADPRSLVWLQQARDKVCDTDGVGHGVFIDLRLGHWQRPEDRLARSEALEQRVVATGHQWLVGEVLLQRLEDRLALGERDLAAVALEAVVDRCRRFAGVPQYRPHTRLRLARVAASCGRQHLAVDLLREALQWLGEAELACPVEFGESFRHRNVVNVQLRQAWQAVMDP